MAKSIFPLPHQEIGSVSALLEPAWAFEASSANGKGVMHLPKLMSISWKNPGKGTKKGCLTLCIDKLPFLFTYLRLLLLLRLLLHLHLLLLLRLLIYRDEHVGTIGGQILPGGKYSVGSRA